MKQHKSVWAAPRDTSAAGFCFQFSGFKVSLSECLGGKFVREDITSEVANTDAPSVVQPMPTPLKDDSIQADLRATLLQAVAGLSGHSPEDFRPGS